MDDFFDEHYPEHQHGMADPEIQQTRTYKAFIAGAALFVAFVFGVVIGFVAGSL
jgi:hypothetical protein